MWTVEYTKRFLKDLAAMPSEIQARVEPIVFQALRAVVNAIVYIVVAGCAWRMLPQDFLKWKTVYHYFRAGRLDGTWEQIHAQFVAWERVAQGHKPVPNAASLDSQSVKTATRRCWIQG